jgi:hypothetical protein
MAKRVTADDYELFVAALCAVPPGEARNQCAREIVAVLLRLYAKHGVSAPAGLVEYARMLGLGPE